MRLLIVEPLRPRLPTPPALQSRKAHLPTLLQVELLLLLLLPILLPTSHTLPTVLEGLLVLLAPCFFEHGPDVRGCSSIGFLSISVLLSAQSIPHSLCTNYSTIPYSYISVISSVYLRLREHVIMSNRVEMTRGAEVMILCLPI